MPVAPRRGARKHWPPWPRRVRRSARERHTPLLDLARMLRDTQEMLDVLDPVKTLDALRMRPIPAHIPAEALT